MNDHHRWMIRASLKHLAFFEASTLLARRTDLAAHPNYWYAARSPITGELARSSARLGRKHPGRSRARHESVSFLCSLELLGRTLSGQSPQCRKGQRRPDCPGQPLAAGHPNSVCVGSSSQKGLLFERQVLALSRRRKEKSDCRSGTYLTGAGLRSVRAKQTLSGTPDAGA